MAYYESESDDEEEPTLSFHEQLKHFNQIASTGQLFLKYTGKRRRKPHDRIVRVSFDTATGKKAQEISWSVLSKNKINFEDIEYIAYGHWTPAFEARKDSLNADLCFSVVAKNNITLNLQAQSQNMAKLWVKGLRQLIGHTDEEDQQLAKLRLDNKEIEKEHKKRTKDLMLLQQDLFVMTTTTVFRNLEEEKIWKIDESVRDKFDAKTLYEQSLRDDVPWRQWNIWIRTQITEYLRNNGGCIDNAKQGYNAHAQPYYMQQPQQQPFGGYGQYGGYPQPLSMQGMYPQPVNYNINMGDNNNVKAWICSVCTFKNNGGNMKCSMCQQGKNPNIEPMNIMSDFTEIAKNGQLFEVHSSGKKEEKMVKVRFDDNGKAMVVSWGNGGDKNDCIEFKDILYVSWGHLTPIFETKKYELNGDLCLSVVSKAKILDIESQSKQMAELWVKGLRKLIGQTDEESDNFAKQALLSGDFAEVNKLQNEQNNMNAMVAAMFFGGAQNVIQNEENKGMEEEEEENNNINIKNEEEDKKEEINGEEAVKRWLIDEVKLPQYVDIFIDEGYDDLKVIINTVNEDDLVDIGINKKGHRKKIMMFIKERRKSNDNGDNMEGDGDNMDKDDIIYEAEGQDTAMI